MSTPSAQGGVGRAHRRDYRSGIARARLLVAIGVAFQIGYSVHVSWTAWSGSGTSVAAAVIIVGVPVMLGLFALRKPWGVSNVLLVTWTIAPIGFAIADVGVSGLNKVAAATVVLASGLLLAAFVIALRSHLRRPDPWRPPSRWDDWLPP